MSALVPGLRLMAPALVMQTVNDTGWFLEVMAVEAVPPVTSPVAFSVRSPVGQPVLLLTVSFNTVVFLLEVQVMVPPLARLEALPLALAYSLASALGTAHSEMVTVLVSFPDTLLQTRLF